MHGLQCGLCVRGFLHCVRSDEQQSMQRGVHVRAIPRHAIFTLAVDLGPTDSSRAQKKNRFHSRHETIHFFPPTCRLEENQCGQMSCMSSRALSPPKCPCMALPSAFLAMARARTRTSWGRDSALAGTMNRSPWVGPWSTLGTWDARPLWVRQDLPLVEGCS